MSINICHASIDENGHAHGGSAGDQTGREVCIRTWYSKPWKVMLRYSDATVAQKAAEIAAKLCKSNLVGYDQYQRNTLYQRLKANNWDVDAYIKSGVKSETDCSAFVYACYCCLIPAMRSDSNAPTTSTMQAFFTRYGFEAYTAVKYLSSDSLLMMGDVLVKPGSHTVMAYGNGGAVKTSTTTSVSTASTDERTIWEFLLNKLGNTYGAAGLMGNLYAESALRSDNLQNSYENKLGYSDSSYTKAVDNGTYTNFVYDAAGYGLAQWTYWTRKRNLLRFAQERGASIADLSMQLDFLWQEISGYRTVLNTLTCAESVRAASDAVLVGFERPADQSESVKIKRASYGQKYYDQYAGKDTNVTTTTDSFVPYKVRCTASSLNVREVPDGTIIGIVKRDHQFTIRAIDGKWGRVCVHPDDAPDSTITGWVYLYYTEKLS